MKRIIIIFIILIISISCAKNKNSINNIEDNLSPEERLFQQATEYYNKRKWGKAQELLQKYMFSFPASKNVQLAQYYLADAYYNDKNYAQAIVEFNFFLNNYKNYQLREDSYYKLAMSYYKISPSYQFDQTLTRNGISVIEDYKIEYPGESSAKIDSVYRLLLSRIEEKKFHTGNFYLIRKQYKAAEVYFNGIISENLLPEYRDMYLYKYAYTEYKLKNYDNAVNFLSMIDENGKYYKKSLNLLNNIENKIK